MEDEPTTSETKPEVDAATDLERREFLSKAVSIVTGGVIVAVPVAAGLGTLLAPLGAGGQGGLKLRLAEVADLPDDGSPKRFDVIAERNDAWTKYPKKAIGSVWLRKLAEDKVVAFNTSCPHLGCSVDFDSTGGQFSCPCHASSFDLKGERLGKSVSPRGMDSLDVDQEKLTADGEVWVTFVNFRTKVAEKVPV